MRKIIFLLMLATLFFACKTEASDSTDTTKGPWKVTIDIKTAPGLSSYELSVEDGKPINSQLTQTPNNPFDFITSKTAYGTGDAIFTGYRDQDGTLYDPASTAVTKDITVSAEWGFKNFTEEVCKTKTDPNPVIGYIKYDNTDDFAGVYCNSKGWGNLDKLYYGSTFLALSAYTGDLDFVKYFILRGANVNIVTGNKDTALIKAAYSNNYEIVKYLVDNGATLDTKGNDGNTALTTACNYDDSDNAYNIVKYLVDKGANVNLQTDLGNTALITAVSNGMSLRIVKYLVEIGKADLSLTNSAGKSALAFATSLKSYGQVQLDIFNYLTGLPTTP